MDQEGKELLESIDNRLKWLLRFEIENSFEDSTTKKEKIRELYQMGFSNEEMAEVANTTKGSVRATLSDLRGEGEIDD